MDLISIKLENKNFLAMSLIIWLFTMPMQLVLVDALRFQIAHIGQIISLIFLIPVLKEMSINRFELKTLLFFLMLLLFSIFTGFKNVYGLFLGVFYTISSLQILIYIKFIISQDSSYFNLILRILTFSGRSISFFILIYFLLEPKFFYSFLMQDKTYFLVYVFTLIFLELFYYKYQKKDIKLISYFYILFLIFILITSASRSIAFFVPLCVAILIDALLNKSVKVHVKYLVVLSLISFFSYVFYTLLSVTDALDIEDPLYAFNRFISALDSSDSTRSTHFLFLNIAIIEKFNSLENFLFGVGLANFQFAARDSLIFGELSQYESYMRYAVYSPSFLYMPGVSIWGELFLELPIFLFIPILLLAINLITSCFFNKNYFNFLFIFGIFGAGFFYSLHHSSTFYLGLFLAILVRYSYLNIGSGEINES